MKFDSITDLTAAIKAVLEPNFRSFDVKGEISNFKQQTSGHLYFSLKDAGAQISAVLFRGNAAQLTRMPKEGDQVIASGELSLYAPRGQYQIIIRQLQFLGVGELLLRFHQLKEKLKAKGWFDPQRKKALPKFPKKIGIVTSPTGAVVRDILHVLKRRFSNVQVILNPVKVQGEGAAQEIARAIEELNRFSDPDLLIVGRGGGSIEDLWAFNEEIVAKAIFESRIPIISAVGHETDFTISDWVADLRAPTPSAAAEIAVQEKANLLKFLLNTRQTTHRQATQRISRERERLANLQKHPLFSSPLRILSQRIQQLDAARANLDLLKPSNCIELWRERFASHPERLESTLKTAITEKKEKLKRLWAHLRSLNPQNLLLKGYAILFSENDTLIHSANDLQPDQPFRVLLHDGRVVAKTVSRS
ncbi:MAG TPA: exodeoxyribonuclease VII large subunit [Chlamydiales bacterium]|nr:exodeoxyribonuclease VII large subunit [Chlamydiales bacterium]